MIQHHDVYQTSLGIQIISSRQILRERLEVTSIREIIMRHDQEQRLKWTVVMTKELAELSAPSYQTVILLDVLPLSYVVDMLGVNASLVARQGAYNMHGTHYYVPSGALSASARASFRLLLFSSSDDVLSDA